MSQLRDLARRFPKDTIKENPNGYGSYVPHHLYAQRLLMHLGGYSLEVVEVLRGDVPEIKPNPKGTSQRAKDGSPALHNVIVGVVARLSVTVDGQDLRVEDCGDCEQPHNWDHDGARLKDAVSDALKRCSARIGLGLHLYARHEDEYVLYRVLTDREKGADAPLDEATHPIDVTEADDQEPRGVTADGEVVYAPDDPGRPFE